MYLVVVGAHRVLSISTFHRHESPSKLEIAPVNSTGRWGLIQKHPVDSQCKCPSPPKPHGRPILAQQPVDSNNHPRRFPNVNSQTTNGRKRSHPENFPNTPPWLAKRQTFKSQLLIGYPETKQRRESLASVASQRVTRKIPSNQLIWAIVTIDNNSTIY